MLQQLTIKNYAIINELTIQLSDGLNIITGETGAGKSILVGALNLILGQRADTSVLLNEEKKCVVEALFTIKKTEPLSDFFMQLDLEFDPELIIRREISQAGKSRCFINDSPVNLAQLKMLSALLVDLHQQFDTIELGTDSFQRDILDAFSENLPLIPDMKGKFTAYLAVKKELQQLIQLQENSAKELDYHQFLFDELNELNLHENELENLDQELQLLNNAESIKQQIVTIYTELNDSDEPMVARLKGMQQRLSGIEKYHPLIQELVHRLSATVIELRDIGEELERIEGGISTDAERVNIIQEKISSGYKLLKKHSVQDTAGLITIRGELEQKLESVNNLTSEIERLNTAVNSLRIAAEKCAQKISQNRSKHIAGFVEQVNKMLVAVGMPNARLKIDSKPAELSQYGMDTIQFLFDANKSDRFEVLSKVASGGELSRLMLCMKSLVARKLSLPTLIFDEIDTGISGEAAKQVGIIMQQLSETQQLIAITHQPQIAARAKNHLWVYKHEQSGKIETAIRNLNTKERVDMIAQMIGGAHPSAAALENARELVETS